VQSRIVPADHTSGPTPELPALDPGLQLLETGSEDIAIGSLHSLVLDHLLLNPGRAYWVDTGGHIAPHHLARIAPSPRVLDRVQVARGFTPYQHYSLVSQLDDCLDREEPTVCGGSLATEGAGVSLLVVPRLDALYRDESELRGGHREGREMFFHSLAILQKLARRYSLPVLTSLSHGSSFTAPVTRAAKGTIRCEQTRFGPRFTVDGDTDADHFETLVYPVGHGMVQTTLAFWHEVLTARAPLYEQARPTVGPASSSAGSVRDARAGASSEVMADGAGTY